MKIVGNTQEAGRKFLGHFKCNFLVTHIIQINQTALNLMNKAKISKKSEFYYSL